MEASLPRRKGVLPEIVSRRREPAILNKRGRIWGRDSGVSPHSREGVSSGRKRNDALPVNRGKVTQKR